MARDIPVIGIIGVAQEFALAMPKARFRVIRGAAGRTGRRTAVIAGTARHNQQHEHAQKSDKQLHNTDFVNNLAQGGHSSMGFNPALL